MTLPRFFHPGLEGTGPIELHEDEAHHLRHVLRLRPGDEVLVFDGLGRQRRATVSGVTRAAVTLTPGEEVVAAPELPIRVTLGIAVLKPEAMDRVIRDAVMLGVRAIVPIVAERSVVPASRIRDTAVLERWARIALASTRQCGRAWRTIVEPARSLDDLLALPAERTFVLVEPALRVRQEGAALPREGAVTVLSGPEGGWTAGELVPIREAGAEPMSLGPMTLRAEVAPIAALGVLSWWATRDAGPTRNP